MPHVLRKFVHYAIRIIAAFVSWLVLTAILMCIPAFTEISNSSVVLTSPLPILIPLAAAVGIFFLIKQPLNNSIHFYNPDAFSSTTGFRDSQCSSVDIPLMAIDLMDGLTFEYWCANLLTNSGYSNVEVTRGSGDQGVDVLAQKDGIKYAIQCKCYSSNLGNTPIQEVNTGKVIYHCHVGAVMTNRYFTKGAKEAAEATGVLLWDRDWIADNLKVFGIPSGQDTGKAPTMPDASDHTPHIEDSQVFKIPSGQDTCESSTVSGTNDHIPHIEDSGLFCTAVDAVLSSNKATVSVIQRKLKISYAPAARLMDAMESYNIVGPFQGSTPREILITNAQWENMRTRFQ